MVDVILQDHQKRRKRLGTFISLRHTDYRYLWIGNLFNMAGFWIQNVTIGWLVWELSGSAAMVGIAAGLRSLPFLFMGPLGGVAADRMDRRRLLMVSQTIMAVAAVLFALLVAFDWVRVWHAMVFSFVMGCGLAGNMPVRQSLIANTVPCEELGNAIALNAMATNASRVVGPAVGGMLIMAFGTAGNFLLQAALYLSMVAIIFPMKVPYRDTGSAGKSSPLDSLKEGIQLRLEQQDHAGPRDAELHPYPFRNARPANPARFHRRGAPRQGGCLWVPRGLFRHRRPLGHLSAGLVRQCRPQRMAGHDGASVRPVLRGPFLAIDTCCG